ncbi:MAG: ATP-binding protein [Halioglobus sp.]
MRNRLFFKAFLGFWLVSICILLAGIAATRYFDLLPTDGGNRQGRPGPPPEYLVRLMYSLQNASDEELPALVDKTEARGNVTLYLLNRQGEEILGKDTPREARRAADQLKGRKRRASVESPQGRFLAHALYRREQGPLKVVAHFKSQGTLQELLLGNSWLRIAIAVLLSGTLCYLATLLMTRRLATMSRVSRQLARGNLEARIPVRERGGDETDDLARDFNEMADQLKQRIQAQRRLLQDVSHELRSPLARLKIALAMAQDHPDAAAQYLSRMEKETDRLNDLIGQLLTIQGAAVVLDRHIDLVTLLTMVTSDAQFEANTEKQSVQVLFQCDLEEAIVATAGDLLQKGFENIVRNAIKYTQPDTAVIVSLQRRDSDYIVTVTDEGPGVPAQDLDNIFEAFYRIDQARGRDSGGYGLGLAISKQAIAQHGGSIVATNIARGLQITVSLPSEASS